MIIYHGSTIIVDYPRIIKNEVGRDFGTGFYTTDIIDQAIRWAKRKAFLSKNSLGILNKYEFDETAFHDLKYIGFPEPNEEWLDMVCKCRKDISYNHGYDLVSGKIANDNVGETVEYVLRGIMRREDAIERLKFEKINNQICFCTEQSLPYLKFISAEEV